MISKDEKRFLKWFIISVILAVLILKLTDWGVLGSFGAGVTLFLIIHGVYRYRSSKAGREAAVVSSTAHTALELKFGRWTLLAKYGPLGLVGVTGQIFSVRPTPITFRLMMASLAFFFIEGLYLCYLVAAYRADLKEEHNDGKTV